MKSALVKMVKCIDASGMPNALTVGKEYQVLGIEGRRLLIAANDGDKMLVEASRFEIESCSLGKPPNCS